MAIVLRKVDRWVDFEALVKLRYSAFSFMEGSTFLFFQRKKKKRKIATLLVTVNQLFRLVFSSFILSFNIFKLSENIQLLSFRLTFLR